MGLGSSAWIFSSATTVAHSCSLFGFPQHSVLPGRDEGCSGMAATLGAGCSALGWATAGGEREGTKESRESGHWGRRGSALYLNPVRSFVSRIGFDGAQMGTVNSHEGKSHHLARGKADLAGVTGTLKLQGCKTSATNKCLRASGRRLCQRGGRCHSPSSAREVGGSHTSKRLSRCAVGGQEI